MNNLKFRLLAFALTLSTLSLSAKEAFTKTAPDSADSHITLLVNDSLTTNPVESKGAIFNETLTNGEDSVIMSGPDPDTTQVYNIQSFLHLNGFNPNGVDGVDGGGFRTAIGRYLDSTNQVNPETGEVIVNHALDPIRNELNDLEQALANYGGDLSKVPDGPVKNQIDQMRTRVADYMNTHIAQQMQDPKFKADMIDKAQTVVARDNTASTMPDWKAAAFVAGMVDPNFTADPNSISREDIRASLNRAELANTVERGKEVVENLQENDGEGLYIDGSVIGTSFELGGHEGQAGLNLQTRRPEVKVNVGENAQIGLLTGVEGAPNPTGDVTGNIAGAAVNHSTFLPNTVGANISGETTADPENPKITDNMSGHVTAGLTFDDPINGGGPQIIPRPVINASGQKIFPLSDNSNFTAAADLTLAAAFNSIANPDYRANMSLTYNQGLGEYSNLSVAGYGTFSNGDLSGTGAVTWDTRISQNFNGIASGEVGYVGGQLVQNYTVSVTLAEGLRLKGDDSGKKYGQGISAGLQVNVQGGETTLTPVVGVKTPISSASTPPKPKF